MECTRGPVRFYDESGRKLVPPKRHIPPDISLSFFPGAEISVLGLNGAGKSTLLRIMAGVDKEFDGEARPQPGIRIGYLQQEPELDPDKSVREIIEEGVADTLDLVKAFNFLDRIVTHILTFEGDSRVTWFEGNYEEYEKDRRR